MNRDDRRQGGFTLVELITAAAILVVVLIGFGATSSVATRTMQTNERRAESCEKVLRCFQRIRQFTRAGVLSTFKVLATSADVAAGRATAVGEWIDPVDGEPRTVAQFRSADGILAMNANSLTPPIELRFELEDAENPAANTGAVDGEDDDRDGLIDEGQLLVTHDGVQATLSTGIESCWLTLDGSLLLVQIRTARRTTDGPQFLFEQAFTLRNN